MIFPSREDIVNLNHYHIHNSGGLYEGSDNLLHPGSLEWVLEVIQYPLFSVDLYPTLAEKAAVLAWTIVAGHVFHDGNKRTGISTLKIFLHVNNYDLEATDEELIDVALTIARASTTAFSLRDFVHWTRIRLRYQSNVANP